MDHRSDGCCERVRRLLIEKYLQIETGRGCCTWRSKSKEWAACHRGSASRSQLIAVPAEPVTVRDQENNLWELINRLSPSSQCSVGSAWHKAENFWKKADKMLVHSQLVLTPTDVRRAQILVWHQHPFVALWKTREKRAGGRRQRKNLRESETRLF